MNNNEARAYAAIAMNEAGVPHLYVADVMDEMWKLFDSMTVERAVEIGSPLISRAESMRNRMNRLQTK